MVKKSDFYNLSAFNELMKTLDPNELFKLRMLTGTEYIRPLNITRVGKRNAYKYETSMTILHHCIIKGFTKHIKILLNRGDTIIDTKSSDGNTALHYATSNPWSDVIEIMDLLLEKGADPHAIDLQSFTPLQQLLLNHRDTPELYCERIDVLLNNKHNKADPNYQSNIIDSTRTTPIRNHLPLIQLCKGNMYDLDVKLKVCKMLLDAGADPNKYDVVEGNGMKITPMHAAVYAQYIDKASGSYDYRFETVKYILNTRFETATFKLMKTYGGIIDRKNKDGTTPLSYFFEMMIDGTRTDDINNHLKELVNIGCDMWETKQFIPKWYFCNKTIDRRLARERMYELILCLKTKKQLATKTMFGYGKIILEMIDVEKEFDDDITNENDSEEDDE